MYMRKSPDLIGCRFGKLVVLKFDKYENRKGMWICQCDCGRQVRVSTNGLRCGNTKSCGCKRKESLHNAFSTHGRSGCRLYKIWAGIIQRTENPNNPSYCYYGERGIKVCKAWQDSFRAFEQWALKNGYQDNLTIERIDNDLGYSPENCKWATVKQQCSNRRSNHLITYEGETRTLTQWAEILKISRSTLSSRIFARKWSIEKAFTTKVK